MTIYHLHIYLYAKGHYQESDIINDLKTIMCNYSNIEPCFISYNDILKVVIEVALDAIEFGYENQFYTLREMLYNALPNQSWRVFGNKNESPEITMIKSCLSVIRFSKMDKRDFTTKPNSKILPLRRM